MNVCMNICWATTLHRIFSSPSSSSSSFPSSLCFFSCTYTHTLTYFICTYTHSFVSWTNMDSSVHSRNCPRTSTFFSFLVSWHLRCLLYSSCQCKKFFSSLLSFFLSSYSFACTLFFSLCLIQCYYSIYTFKVLLPYMGTLCKLSHTF